MRREAKKDSDDEEETSGNFFTINEPELPAVPLPVNIENYTQAAPVAVSQIQEVHSYLQIPANQLYNMAAMADSDTPQPTDLVQMELDDVAVSISSQFSYLIICSLFSFIFAAASTTRDFRHQTQTSR